MTLNRRAARTIASFYGSAVPAGANICRVKTRSRRRLERDSIQCGIEKHKDTLLDVAPGGPGTDTRSAPRLYFGRVARARRCVRARLRDRGAGGCRNAGLGGAL